jgi:hypothetical protein
MRIDVTFDAVATVVSIGVSDCGVVDGGWGETTGEAAGEAEDELRPKPSFHLLAFLTIGGATTADGAIDACVPTDTATLSTSPTSGATYGILFWRESSRTSDCDALARVSRVRSRVLDMPTCCCCCCNKSCSFFPLRAPRFRRFVVDVARELASSSTSSGSRSDSSSSCGKRSPSTSPGSSSTIVDCSGPSKYSG